MWDFLTAVWNQKPQYQKRHHQSFNLEIKNHSSQGHHPGLELENFDA